MATLAENLAIIVDGLDPVAVAAYNEAVDLINQTRTNIAAVTAAGLLATAKAAVVSEDVTVLVKQGSGGVKKAVTQTSGPAAMFGTKQGKQG